MCPWLRTRFGRGNWYVPSGKAISGAICITMLAAESVGRDAISAHVAGTWKIPSQIMNSPKVVVSSASESFPRLTTGAMLAEFVLSLMTNEAVPVPETSRIAVRKYHDCNCAESCTRMPLELHEVAPPADEVSCKSRLTPACPKASAAPPAGNICAVA